MGYEVSSIFLHSLKDNKRYKMSIPNEHNIQEFENLLNKIYQHRIEEPFQQIITKCNQCIYSTLCDVN